MPHNTGVMGNYLVFIVAICTLPFTPRLRVLMHFELVEIPFPLMVECGNRASGLDHGPRI